VSGESRIVNEEDSRLTTHDSRLQVAGTVTRQLPSGLYEVDVEGRRITAHLGRGSEKNFVRVLVGDRVAGELTPGVLCRGRIVSKGDRR
jgi:translation initiation factor IF-1